MCEGRRGGTCDEQALHAMRPQWRQWWRRSEEEKTACGYTCEYTCEYRCEHTRVSGGVKMA